jgi:hypothetical protein
MAAIVNKPPPRALQIRSAAVHPLVLLHVVDHFNRATINKRICGVLLGSIQKDGTAEVTNAFASKSFFSKLKITKKNEVAFSSL